MKTAERDMARKLRREEGLSVREIQRRLGVSRSSVSLWVRDIELTADQREALLSRNPAYNGQLSGSAANAAKWRYRRRCWQEEGRAQARLRDPFHAAGCMLYWAEGSKARCVAQIVNADAEVVRFFVAFLRTYFEIPKAKVRVRCHLFADHAQQQYAIEQFWLDLVGVPRSCLNKSAVNVYSRHSKRKRLNMLPYGTCSVSVCSTRIVQHIYGAIQEYGGFDRPEWLG